MVVKIVDFGISKQIVNWLLESEKVKTEKSTSTGFSGTLSYMAPELVAKRTKG